MVKVIGQKRGREARPRTTHSTRRRFYLTQFDAGDSKLTTALVFINGETVKQIKTLSPFTFLPVTL